MTKEMAINYLKSSGMTDEQIETVINALTCEDCISREALIQSLQMHRNFFASSYGSYQYMAPKDKVRVDEIDNCIARVVNAPSVTPKFTDTEIQKMQELEQAQLEKAYELGRAEIQPCEDCISRTALLARIDEERKHLLALKMDGAEHIIVHHARRIIEDMPSVTPQTEWIPVTERLPEKSGKYLVTVKNGNVYAGTYDAFSGKFQCAATAWQPLSEPYRHEENLK